MHNKILTLGTSISVAILALLIFVTFAQAQQAAPDTTTSVTTAILTPAERDGLIYMREEEKLARDVYLALYAKWNVPIFNNIVRAESQHMAAIKALLDRYGIPDPAAGKAPGQFTNPQLQSLYNELVAKGNTSLPDALAVGVTIEKVDIQDLETRLGETSRWDIQRVLNNLLRGSQNHLRAFQRQQF